MLVAKKQIDGLLNRYQKTVSGRIALNARHTEEILFRFREEIAGVVTGSMYNLPEQQAEELVVFADSAVDRFQKVLGRQD